MLGVLPAAATALSINAGVTCSPAAKPMMQPFCAPLVRSRRVSFRVSIFAIATVFFRCAPAATMGSSTPAIEIGNGANPANHGTPGGGSGGAIYNDGDRMTLSVAGSLFTGNHANEGGGAIFFVSDDRTGTMTITDSTLDNNPNDGFHTAGLPGIFFLGARPPTIARSTLR